MIRIGERDITRPLDSGMSDVISTLGVGWHLTVAGMKDLWLRRKLGNDFFWMDTRGVG